MRVLLTSAGLETEGSGTFNFKEYSVEGGALWVTNCTTMRSGIF